MAVDLDARGLAAAALMTAGQGLTPEKQQQIIDAVLAVVEPIVDAITALIPYQASPQNQLADKEFTNSSIATNTAHYIYKTVGGEKVPFSSLAELEAYSGTVTPNDYAFVAGTDSEGNAYYDRYKASVDGSTVTWAKEFRLNNSSFTAEQWAAISSGITAAAVAKIYTALQPADLLPNGTITMYSISDPLTPKTFEVYIREQT